jgi:glycosyltransferase involved in cell wall biosynthesis
MRCPTVSELPAPPRGKSGWPWTVGTAPTPEPSSGRDEWPRITVVTPSYQQGAFLEETIRSVLLQSYSDLEYIVLDGGSTDGTVEILERYEPWLAYWRSHPDGGQASAVNEGLRLSSGERLAWLNSDDFYAPGALLRAGAVPQSDAWVVGETGYVDEAGARIGRFPRAYRATSLVEDDELAWIDVVCATASGTALPQQSTFWSAAARDAVGDLDEGLEFLFEHDLWIRLSYAGFAPTLVPEELTMYRRHPAQKTRGFTRAAAFLEEAKVTARWLDSCPEQHQRALAAYSRWCMRRSWAARGRQVAARLMPSR